MMSLLTSCCVLSCVGVVDIGGTLFACDCGVDVTTVFTLGDGSWTCFLFVLMDCRWPFTVASDRGGYRRTCWLDMSGKVVRYPALMAFVNVSSVGENIDAW